jgi:hypothetical protein
MPSPVNYERVTVSSLRRSRHGKHFDLRSKILQDLETLPAGSAIKIPLAEVGETTLANLRSAVHRATTSKNLHVETSADTENFYIWRSE